MVTIFHLIVLSSFYDLIFLMESNWKDSVKSPKWINLWHNVFNIISEMCSFILSWFSKVSDFEWALFIFDFELFCTCKGLFTAKQLKQEKTWAILESTTLALAKLLLTEQGSMP